MNQFLGGRLSETDSAKASKQPVVTLYHVTLTATVSKIEKKGILPLQASNWAQAGSKER